MKTIAMTAPGGPEVLELREPLARRWMFVISLALFIIYASSTNADDIYRCNDEMGRIVFSDKPCSESAEKIQIKNTQPASGVRLKLLHNEEPINTITKVDPLFSLEMQKDGNYVSYFRRSPSYNRFPKRYNPTDGTYSILANMTGEGTYVVHAAVDANPGNPINYPGDYQGGVAILIPREKNAVFNVHLEKVIHLLQPQDNDSPLLKSVHSCENIFSTKGSVNILWESLGPNVRYVYDIKRIICKPYCCGHETSVLNNSTTDTFLIPDLPVNNKDEIYSLTINAWDTITNKPVGSLISHGQRGYTSDYRFRIVK
ncbi:MAG: DUF4124 domain-containing protein [Sulfuricaulis sp.]